MDVGSGLSPRVSVLLPVYGGAAHVGAAVESVLAQTFADFELLVLDDCSPDESAAIAEGFGDERIRVVRNERNLGQVATLNRGLRKARGELVARLDQDDVCLPRRLERQVALLDAEPAVAVVGAWVDVVDESGRVVDTLRTPLDGVVDAVFLTLRDRLPLAHPSVTLRREPALAAGGYDESVRYCEDMDLWRRLLLAGHGLRVVREPLLRYLVHGGQQSSRHAEEQRANNEAALERFLAAVAPEADARLLRLLFTRELDLWRELDDGGRLVRSLELLLDGAAARFGLAPAERDDLERRVRAHVARVAAAGWRTGSVHWRRVAPALARFGGGGVRFAAAYAASPALALARASLGRRSAGGERA
ncbi:MAG TPA: glycosyltransferase [Gaiellaceae bacterium]|nr:glycosyltransferase [Gaiellaceae bacterium]